MAEMNFVTLAEAAEILAARGIPIEVTWLRKKCAAGKIDGAQRVTPRLWLIPRSWAQEYVKDTRGRPRKND